ncbi:MAG: ATP-dependent zinc protease, partial [Gammaproteobacteria bacterium]|nr:ATP-dependent zinc protease [Gammaproteobacteria bacterium]
MTKHQHLTVAGWREWVALPQLNIPNLKAKLDTGARTSALHAFHVDPFDRDGQLWVRFGIHPIQHDTDHVVECEALVIDQRDVSDSGGHTEKRFVIATQINMGDYSWHAECTLTNRDSMKFRMLLGRTALSEQF